MPVSSKRKPSEPKPDNTPSIKRPSHCTIWVDGSIHSKGQGKYGVGAGWVIYNTDNKEFMECSKPLENENSGSSLAAEFRAAALALKETGPHVTLYTDCQAVKKFLERGIRPQANRGTPEQQKYLDGVTTHLLNAARGKAIVIPRRRKKSDQTKIDTAHNLANEASRKALELQPD
jgi:ribonuclease HI